jgi:hypothetical protein
MVDCLLAIILCAINSALDYAQIGGVNDPVVPSRRKNRTQDSMGHQYGTLDMDDHQGDDEFALSDPGLCIGYHHVAHTDGNESQG